MLKLKWTESISFQWRKLCFYSIAYASDCLDFIRNGYFYYSINNYKNKYISSRNKQFVLLDYVIYVLVIKYFTECIQWEKNENKPRSNPNKME